MKKPKKYNPFYHAKRNEDPVPLSNALNDMFKSMRLDGKVTEIQILKLWNESMGEFISRQTSSLFLRNGELTVRVDSSVLRKELQMHEQSIISMLNTKMGGDIITKVIIR